MNDVILEERQEEQQEEPKEYYRVFYDRKRIPFRDHLQHGFRYRSHFRRAVRKLTRKFGGRIGECTGEKNGFHRLRFLDTPGNRPDEIWIPDYVLERVPPPDDPSKGNDPMEDVIDTAFGFDIEEY